MKISGGNLQNNKKRYCRSFLGETHLILLLLFIFLLFFFNLVGHCFLACIKVNLIRSIHNNFNQRSKISSFPEKTLSIKLRPSDRSETKQ